MRELGPINSGAPAFPLATSAIAPCVQRPRPKARAIFPHCGRVRTRSDAEMPAAQLTRELAAGLQLVLQILPNRCYQIVTRLSGAMYIFVA